MKKFVIVSIILLTIGIGAFAFSLYHFIGVEKAKTATPDELRAITEAPKEMQEKETIKTTESRLSDEGIFSANYEKAAADVEKMTTEQMIGQMILGINAGDTAFKNNLSQYNLGGCLLKNESIDYMSQDEVKKMLNEYKTSTKTPVILAAEEEGGKVTTVSGHDAFADYVFDSPRNLYESGGLEAAENAETKKAELLSSLGFNMNLAPVVDMSEEFNQIMYSRSLGADKSTVSQYARFVIETMQSNGVSATLKHFPGYGTIPDTTESVVVDTRDRSTIESVDMAPFESGIEAGAHFVMTSNVVVEKIDSKHTASLSADIHKILRDKLQFTGLIITDEIDKQDYSAYADNKSVYVSAVLAGNDMILARDYISAYNDILKGVNDKTIPIDTLKTACTRILAYKYAAKIIE